MLQGGTLGHFCQSSFRERNVKPPSSMSSTVIGYGVGWDEGTGGGRSDGCCVQPCGHAGPGAVFGARKVGLFPGLAR